MVAVGAILRELPGDMDMTFNIHEFVTNDELTAVLADNVVMALRQSIDERGYASMAVSGGSTPHTLFQRLSNIDLDWGRVWLTLVDERWVDESDIHSNANLVRTSLLKEKAAAARFISLKTGHTNPFTAQADVEQRLSAMPLPFAVVLLGMGSDGHTASFFPQAEQLTHALDLHSGRMCVAIHPPRTPHERMTLTLPMLLNTTLLVVHIVGREKRSALEQAAATTGAVSEMPIRAVLHQKQIAAQIYYAER